MAVEVAVAEEGLMSRSVAVAVVEVGVRVTEVVRGRPAFRSTANASPPSGSRKADVTAVSERRRSS